MEPLKIQSTFRNTVGIIWPIIREQKKLFAIGMGLVLSSTAIEIVLPIIVGKTVDAVGPSQPTQPLYYFAFLFLALITTKGLIESLQAYVIQKAGQRVTHSLRVLLFQKIEDLSIPYFDKNPSGRLLTRVMNDIKSLSELFTASMSVLVLDFTIIAGTLFAMFALHMKLAFVVLFSFPLVVVLIHFFGKKLAESYRKIRIKLSEMNVFLSETVFGLATIQRLQAQVHRNNQFKKISSDYQKAQMDSLSVFASVMPLTNVINGLCTMLLLMVGGIWVLKGEITIGVIVTFLGYLRNLFQPIRDLVEKYNTFLSSMIAAERVLGILEEPSEHLANAQIPSTLHAPFTLDFKNVSFQYAPNLDFALKNISLTLSPGRSTAIVGATGSGKSTLIRLLLRFYDVNSGHILLNGFDVQTMDKKWLRERIGVIQQEFYIFSGTVRDNLTLGNSTLSDTFLIEQCRKVQIWEYLEKLQGLDTHLFEGGSNLSMGQKQLLQLARVLARNNPIFILDEATASIDRISERKILETLSKHLRDKTCLMIAHRLSTIQSCDEIIVFDRGEIKERGSYLELIRQNGVFKHLHDLHLFVQGDEKTVEPHSHT